jgi:hypothetical protein
MIVWAALVARRRSTFHRLYMTPPNEAHMKARHRGGKPAEHAKVTTTIQLITTSLHRTIYFV